MRHFRESILALIEKTSTNLPADVRRALAGALTREEAHASVDGEQRVGQQPLSPYAAQALAIIVQNVDLARQKRGPICQDTGLPTFIVRYPFHLNPRSLACDFQAAVAEATQKGLLRPNSVDILTGKNTGTNLGPGTPLLHWEPWEREEIEVLLLLKGGGGENQSAQYSLPTDLGPLGLAGRDWEGVRKCLLHAIYQAQGHGCSPGFLGVCVGSDRAQGYQLAKKQLFRPVDDVNPVPELAQLEQEVVEQANRLGIGPMGFGGQATLLGCKIGVLNRVPACFFVSVAYNCWALRRRGVVIDPATGEIRNWLYCSCPPPASRIPHPASSIQPPALRLTTPLSEAAVRQLRVGDMVLLSGLVHTGRDTLHAYLLTHDSPVDLRGGVIYHCGPVVVREGEQWSVKAAGPTTSIREEPYQAALIQKFGLRAIIGKGGMGIETQRALQEHGAVYLHAIGGAAQYYAERILAVEGVHFLSEFGVPEAMWHLRVKDFPALVTMDAHGNSLHEKVQQVATQRLESLMGQ